MHEQTQKNQMVQVSASPKGSSQEKIHKIETDLDVKIAEIIDRITENQSCYNSEISQLNQEWVQSNAD